MLNPIRISSSVYGLGRAIVINTQENLVCPSCVHEIRHLEMTPKKKANSIFTRKPQGDFSLLPRVWGGFLEKYRWTHFITLTTQSPTSPELLLKFGQSYIGRIERLAGCRVYRFIIVEGSFDGAAHIHGLLNVDQLTIEQLRKQWRHGITHIVKYDCGRGAASYIAKEILNNDHVDFEFPTAENEPSHKSGTIR